MSYEVRVKKQEKHLVFYSKLILLVSCLLSLVKITVYPQGYQQVYGV